MQNKYRLCTCGAQSSLPTVLQDLLHGRVCMFEESIEVSRSHSCQVFKHQVGVDNYSALGKTEDLVAMEQQRTRWSRH